MDVEIRPQPRYLGQHDGRYAFSYEITITNHSDQAVQLLNRHWITLGPFYRWPLRLLQALALAIWPLRWQYQVYHRCTSSPPT